MENIWKRTEWFAKSLKEHGLGDAQAYECATRLVMAEASGEQVKNSPQAEPQTVYGYDIIKPKKVGVSSENPSEVWFRTKEEVFAARGLQCPKSYQQFKSFIKTRCGLQAKDVALFVMQKFKDPQAACVSFSARWDERPFGGRFTPEHLQRLDDVLREHCTADVYYTLEEISEEIGVDTWHVPQDVYNYIRSRGFTVPVVAHKVLPHCCNEESAFAAFSKRCNKNKFKPGEAQRLVKELSV